MMTRLCMAGLLAVFLAMASPVPTMADESAEKKSPGELAEEGVERLIEALNALVSMIPQYEMPEVLDNGDIIIRRKWPDDEPPEDSELDETNA